MENFTYEELVSMLGKESADIMQAQLDAANSSGGSSIPFPLLKKVADSDAGLGAFGTFVFGTKFAKEKDASNQLVVEDAGTNIGKDFELMICNVSYRYKRWDEVKQRTERSNIFTDMAALDSVIDYSGNLLPSRKDSVDDGKGKGTKTNSRKRAGWKMVKIIGGLVKHNGSWESIIFEIDGTMYFSMNEVLDKTLNKGLLSGIVSIVTKTEKQGSTKYTVVDVEKSSFANLPDGFFKANAVAISNITKEMKKYQESEQYTSAKVQETPNVPAEQSADDKW